MKKNTWTWKEWRCRLYPSKKDADRGEHMVDECIVTASCLHGARLEARSYFGKTPLPYCIRVNHHRTVILDTNSLERKLK